MSKIDFNDWDEDINNNDVDLSFIATKIINTDKVDVIFVDMKQGEDIDEDGDEVVLNGLNETNRVSVGVFKEHTDVDEEFISDEDVKTNFIEKSMELSETNSKELEGFNSTVKKSEISFRKLVAKIMNSSSMIATNGRIGPAQYMIVSEKLYTDMKLSQIPIKPIFHDDTNDIILFRKNTIEQPGLIYLKNENSNTYKLIDIGFYPHKQFIKINIIDE